MSRSWPGSGSANREEHGFDEPYRFDVARQPNRHVAYGDGPHYCIGAAAARATLRATFAEIFRTVGSFEILEPPAHLFSNFVAAIKWMIVPVAPASENGARVGLEGLAWR